MEYILGIDQSLNATGLVLLSPDGRIIKSTTLLFTEKDHLSTQQKIHRVTDAVTAWVAEFHPIAVAMEDYARLAHSASLIPLVELGGSIKFVLHNLGYAVDGGRTSIEKNQPTMLIQNQSNMKKFILGDGHTQKDTMYLLRVFEKTGLKFEDDNQADAYMHALKAQTVRNLLLGKISIEDLKAYQQESLISEKAAKKKGLSKAKAMKADSKTKMDLVVV